MGVRGIKQIMNDFSATKRQFQVNCFTWLSFLFPELKDAVDLGEIDREGVDIYSLSDEGVYNKVYQCKGFEKTFSDSQLKQCLDSINSFVKSGSYTKEYFLIINNHISSKNHVIITNAINNLVSQGFATSARYLTPQTFIDYYNVEFQSFIVKEIIKSNTRFYNSFTNIMEQKFYMSEVNFRMNNREGSNPLQFLLENCKSENYDPAYISKLGSRHFMIVSDFGFGKTSLLLQFFSVLIREKYVPIYIPVSAFKLNTFTNTSNIAKEIFRTITQLDLGEHDKILKFSAESMNYLLTTNPKIILMFDGLDEHTDLYRYNSLRVLFESTVNYISPTIYSFRKSFRDERNSEFEMNINVKHKKNNKTELFLQEWNDSNIVNYLKLFQQNQELLDKEQADKLREFFNLIESSEYDKFYGDIPKRPLFLEMILRDILSDRIKKTNISELYYNYFSEKFQRDLNGQIEGLVPYRDLPEKSIEANMMLLLKIHEKIARKCVKTKGDDGLSNLVIENVINEESITGILKETGYSDFGKFLMISILIPLSKRGYSGMKIRFAHNSFLEYFVARFLLIDFYNLKSHLKKYSEFEFTKPVLNFLDSMIDTEKRNNKDDFQSTANFYSTFSNPIINHIKRHLVG